MSYDGALDPLGASQVVPYLIGLSARCISITLITFEKPERWAETGRGLAMQARLDACGIQWRPLRYHKQPRLAGTLLDVVAGSRAIAREAARCAPALIHSRGDVATLMARWACLPATIRLLYDVRGFFSDERVETGSWRRGSLLDRVVRRMEGANLQRADGAVVLTHHAAGMLRRRRPSLPALQVIPTCADVSVFKPLAPGQKPEFGLVYSGSLGTWYMADEMVAFARLVGEIVPGPALFLTPEPEEVRRLGVTPDWAEIRTVEPGTVGEWLRRARALFFFIRPIPSKRASCPTKFAEGLASGLPVVCNRGIGDLEDIVEQEGVGVLVDGFSEGAYSAAARRLKGLLEDPG
ncbi:MAG TPA: glycosyltransferase, partial [Candidatus Polarisedimenticolia bacterium]|nr:glycosyltransferase [Candidatus Polarisedimenticolia bacterium]